MTVKATGLLIGLLVVVSGTARAADYCQRPSPSSPFGVVYRDANRLNEFNSKNYYTGDIKRISKNGMNSWVSRYYINVGGSNTLDIKINKDDSTITFIEHGHVVQTWKAKYDYKDGNFWFDGNLEGGGYSFSGCVKLPGAVI